MPNTAVPSPSPAPYQAEGLSSAEAECRLRSDGPNALPEDRPRRFHELLIEILKEPMLLLLLAAGGLYWLLGDAAEAAMLMAFVVFVIGLTLVQARRTEHSLRALREISSPRALVLRDGVWTRIAGRDVVVGDRLRLDEGDRVPADVQIRHCHDLAIDESALTGESLPVAKRAHAGEDWRGEPGAEAGAEAYSGTLVVHGQGEAVVVATGARSSLGRIGALLGDFESPLSPLGRETRRLVRGFAALGLALCLGLLLWHGLVLDRWLSGLLAGITLAMAVLPEEFPVVLTVFLALGAWRLARHAVLTRRPAAIEALGSVSVICVDKTGTLTQNRMAVVALVAPEASWRRGEGALPTGCVPVLETALLACEPEPSEPMERAIAERAEGVLAVASGSRLVHDYPRTDDRPAMVHVWRIPGQEACIIAAKGAPETLFRFCRLAPEAGARWSAVAGRLAGDGLRVLAVARAVAPESDWPEDPAAFPFQLLGLLALADPLRPEVPAAVAECRRAGMRVVMVTGDYPATARAIAAEAGIDGEAGVLLGSELAALDDRQLAERIGRVSVFARVVPELKLRLVRAFQAQGAVVAMTGDGVNDAPALKAADVGIAMGARGTDVAREAADLVLLDDHFASLVTGIRLGRRILDNLRKAMAYILAVHVPIAVLSLLPPLLGWPTLFWPAHIALLQFLIDPACSLVFEAEATDPGAMDRPPRDVRQPWFGPRFLALGLAMGAGVTLVLLGLCLEMRGAGIGEASMRGTLFAALVLSNLALIVSHRSWHAGWFANWRRPGRAFAAVMVLAPAVLALLFAIPGARALFDWAAPTTGDGLRILLAGVLSVLVIEAVKPWLRRLA